MRYAKCREVVFFSKKTGGRHNRCHIQVKTNHSILYRVFCAMEEQAIGPVAPAQAAELQQQPQLQLAIAPAHPVEPHATVNKIFSFGAIADVQYANIADGWNWDETRRRYFRGGLVQLRRAVDVWLKEERHSFALQLGDCIDGRNRPDGSEAALRDVKVELDRLAEGLPLGVVSSLGNHELYNFSKERWARELDCSSRSLAARLRPPEAFPRSRVTDHIPACLAQTPALEGAEEPGSRRNIPDRTGRNGGKEKKEEYFYFSFCPDSTYRFIALDTHDVNAIRDDGETGQSEESESTAEFLLEQNPNADKNDSTGMDGLRQRFVQYNGGIGQQQLLWLEVQLAEASRAGQRVVLFGHLPTHPDASEAKCLLWNFDEVLAVLHKFDCVAMYICGHTHKDAYHRDNRGIHHVILAAALETPSDQEAFASVDVYSDRLELRGHGVIESRTMLLPGRVGELLVG